MQFYRKVRRLYDVLLNSSIKTSRITTNGYKLTPLKSASLHTHLLYYKGAFSGTVQGVRYENVVTQEYFCLCLQMPPKAPFISTNQCLHRDAINIVNAINPIVYSVFLKADSLSSTN